MIVSSKPLLQDKSLLESFDPIGDKFIPEYINQILHSTPTRVRLSIKSNQVAFETLKNVIASFPEVERVRVSKFSNSLIVCFTSDLAEGNQQDILIGRLPKDCLKLEEVAAKVASTSQHKSVNENHSKIDGDESEDEPFVPSRIILPLSSLGLAILAGPLALPPLFVAGFIFIAANLSFKRAWLGLREEKKLNVDFLDSLAVVLHSLEGFLLGPALMISMIEGGEAVRDATQRIAHSSNTDLVASLQANVNLLINGEEVIVESTSLIKGDKIRLYPGDKIPIDGIIDSGEGSLDVVKLTGESVPRFATISEEVLAGFILLEGILTVEVTAVGKETRVGQITSMIESAPVYDTRVGNFAGKIANRFVLPTLALAGVSLLLSAGNIAQAASLLMFDLGTGLRISVPTAIMAALTRASSQGLLIRSGRSLELLVDIDVVVFDKTGTLTQGHPSIVAIDLLGDYKLDEIIFMAASAEQGLKHPVALSIVEHATSNNIEPGLCEVWDYHIGKGVSATLNGKRLLIGNSKLFHENGITLPMLTPNPEHQTATPVYFSIDDNLEAIIYAADALRPDSKDMISELHRRGIQTHMLTGDVESVAQAVATKIGLLEEEVHAEALPDQKAELVQKLTSQGYKVAFVGDGINDSAALAYADVSISFASGSDLARETADIVLTNDRVSGLIVALDLAKETFALVNQNISIVGVPNISALVLGTFLPVSPIAAVILNNGSAILAAANAMRILGFNPKNLESNTDGLSARKSSESGFSELNHKPGKAYNKRSNGVQSSDSIHIFRQINKVFSDLPPSKTSAEQVRTNSDQNFIPQVMNQKDLAHRVGISSQSLSLRRSRKDFSNWIKSKDPDGASWKYNLKSKNFELLSA